MERVRLLRFALIGKPLGHSLSPQIHGLISEATGLSCEYELKPLEPDEVRPFIQGMGERGIDGLNATIPYKLSALQSVDALSPEAAAIGAVNTVEVTADGLVGHNTDYYGFGAMLQDAGITVRGRRCVILGSGGSARAVAAYLIDAGASEVLLASRDRADASARFPGIKAVSYGELEGSSGGLLVNCTPLGMHPKPEGCPVTKAVVGRFEAVADLIYNPMRTKLLDLAEGLGRKRAGGLYMLAAQAVRAREIWHKVTIGPEVERDVCRRLQNVIEGGT